MNYIGSKRTLLPFLEQTILSVTDLAEPGVFCDLFSGTGVVGAHFKALGWSVIANDLQRYAVVRAGALLCVSSPPAFDGLLPLLPDLHAVPLDERLGWVCAHLNDLPGRADGPIYQRYALGGTAPTGTPRQYFSDENAQRADAVRMMIAHWTSQGALTQEEEYALLAALLEGIDEVANTASVYGAFLKKLKTRAQVPMVVRPLGIIPSHRPQEVHQGDANELLLHAQGDVLYLDPPYNSRQYAANYHVLETIALGDTPEVRGTTGLRDWSAQKSRYSSKRDVRDAFSELLSRARFRWIFLSYNNEGLLTLKDVEEAMSALGEYGVATKEYGRFRADQDGPGRNYATDTVTEYVHWVRVRTP